MLVRRLVATDNDCTVMCPTVFADHGYAARLMHINPRTYIGVMRLWQKSKADNSLREFLANEVAMQPQYIAQFEQSLTAVAQSLHDNCVAGRLKLDLDPEIVFLNAHDKASCDVK